MKGKKQTGFLIKDHVPLHGHKDDRSRSFHILLTEQMRPSLTCNSAGVYDNLPSIQEKCLVFFHFIGKTSIFELLLMIADKEAEMNVMLLLYETCRKYYEVLGPYVEITYLGFLKLPLPYYVAGVMHSHLVTPKQG